TAVSKLISIISSLWSTGVMSFLDDFLLTSIGGPMNLWIRLAFVSEKHLIDTNASLIKHTDKQKELIIWEKIHIQKKKKKNKKDKLMNFKTPANFDLIQ
ncbi:hypothetical protein L9F63_021541, partial [Diploptera punctata]